MKKLVFISLALFPFFCAAQIPSGYYNAANGKSNGTPLKLALHSIIQSNHTALGYPALWSAFSSTDAKPNGKLWDIYSFKFAGTQPYEYTIGSSQCGTYNSEGDCYNREHTWPQTFFNSAEPMVSDLHQIYPTDGWINGLHSNDPYGAVNNSINTTTMNGSKSGTSFSYPGYFNNVFEPIDSFKGDIARSFFYMNARYTTQDAGWGSWPMASGAELTQAAITLLLSWHHLDPVSKKEIDRNNAIYNLQGNRNPFVDYPHFADCIWSSTAVCTPFAVGDLQKNKIAITQLPQALQWQLDHNVEVSIYNTCGQQVVHASQVYNSMPLPPLASGVYVIFLRSEKNIYTQKLVL